MDDKLKKLKSAPRPLRSVGTSDSGNPLYRGLGIVFGGRDLYGDTFSPPREILAGDDPELKIGTNYFLTELADEFDPETGELKNAMEVPVFWDHGLGSLGAKRLGTAIPTRITQEGIEYLIELEKSRAQDYQSMIDELQNMGWLGLSSQTLPSFADMDWWTGDIKSWYVAEMTLTVTPAEHRTRDQMEQVRSLFRKYNLEVKTMADVTTPVVDTPEDVITADAVVDDLLDGLTTQIEGEEAAVMENQALAYVIRSFADIHNTLTALTARLDGIDQQLSKAATTEQVADLNTQFVSALQKAFTGLGEVMSKTVKLRAAEIVQDSADVELQALRSIGNNKPAPPGQKPGARGASMYALPAGAPGQN